MKNKQERQTPKQPFEPIEPEDAVIIRDPLTGEQQVHQGRDIDEVIDSWVKDDQPIPKRGKSDS